MSDPLSESLIQANNFNESLFRVVEILVGLLGGSLARIEEKMAKIDDDLTALAGEVTKVSTDVQAILAKLAAGGVTDAQLAQIEQATAALQTLDQSMQAVLTAG